METFFVQLNTSRTPSGRFPVYATTQVIEVPPDMIDVRVGYDAVVCLQRYEPWIVEAYDTYTGTSSILRVVKEGNDSSPPSGDIRGAQVANTRYLNKTGKDLVFKESYSNSLALMSTANPESFSWNFYAPTPAVGPAVSPASSSNLDLLRRLFLSLKALSLRDTPNCLQPGSPTSAHGLVRLKSYHTLRGLDPSSHNRMRMRPWHTPLTSRGN